MIAGATVGKLEQLRDWLVSTQRRQPQGLSGGEVDSVIATIGEILSSDDSYMGSSGEPAEEGDH